MSEYESIKKTFEARFCTWRLSRENLRGCLTFCDDNKYETYFAISYGELSTY